MHLTFLQYFIWISTAAGDVFLLAVLFHRNLWRRFPFFFGYTAFDLCREFIYLPAMVHGPTSYFYVYWSLSLLGSLLQIALVIELARQIFRPIEAIPRSTIIFGLILCVTSVVTFCAWSLYLPLAIVRRLPGDVTGLNLLLTCLRFALFAFVAAFSRFLGLYWRHYVYGITAGLGIYSCVDLICSAVSAQSGVEGLIALHLSKFSYILAMVAWCFILAKKEPARVMVTPAMRVLLREIRTSLARCQQLLGAREQ